MHISGLVQLCFPCYSQKKDNRRKLKFLDLVQKKCEKVLSLENFFMMSRDVKFYKFFFLDDFQKKLLKVCPTPNKNKIEDPNIFETKIPSLVENIQYERNSLNARVLDYFMNSKD